MGMISGGFGLKKFFEDSDKERDKAATASAPEFSVAKPETSQACLALYHASIGRMSYDLQLEIGL